MVTSRPRSVSAALLVTLLAVAALPVQADTLTLDDDRLPTPRRSVSAAFQGGDIYLFGGYDGNWLADGMRYDLGSDIIVQSTRDLPSARYDMASVTTGRHIFLFGGWGWGDTEAEILRYDPVTNTFQLMPERLDPPRFRATAVWDGQAAYIFGGNTALGVYTDEILRYVPGEPITRMAARLPEPTAHVGATFDGRYIWLFGGTTAEARLDDILRYDPWSDTLTDLTVSLPSARSWTSVVWDGYRAFVFGGLGADDEIIKFDPTNETVTLMDQELDGSYLAAAAWDGDKAYIMGGGVSELTDEILIYDMTPAAPRNVLALPILTGGAQFSWQAVGADTYSWLSGYDVYRRHVGFGSWQHIASLDGDTTRYIDSGLLPGVYEYRATATNAWVDVSDPSPTARVVVV